MEESLQAVFRFTWQAFITTTHAFRAVFLPLRTTYERAVGLTRSWPEAVRKNLDVGLARHLLRLFAWGTEPEGSDMMQRFFAGAAGEDRGRP